METEQNTPELLKAILQINPHVFKGPQYNSPRNWAQGTPVMHTNQTSANYGRFSPSYSNSSGSRQTPQGSPAHPAAARTVLPPPTGMNPLPNMTPQPNMYSPAHMSSPGTPLTTLGNVTPQHHNMAGMTPQHNMHMASPMRTNMPLQQHQSINMQQNMYDRSYDESTSTSSIRTTTNGHR